MYDKRELIEAFEDCVSKLETGADLESVLNLYPDMAVELRPLLETVDRALMMSVSSAPQDVINRGRTRILSRAAAMRQAAEKPRKSGFVFKRWATSLVLALVFFLGGTGVVNASSVTLPGDNLYPVKRAWEEVRLWFERSPSGREALESEYEQERLDEIGELLADGREETIAFSGIVIAQNESYWIISDVPVQITADTHLSVETISVGAPVTVVGRTNAQGFIQAQRISLLEPGASLPPLESEELEKHQEENSSEESEGENEKQKTYKFQGVVTTQQGYIWFINNQRVNVRDAEINGDINPGDFVEFEGYYDDNREFMVTKIELKTFKQGPTENENLNNDSGKNNGDDDDKTTNNNTNVNDDDDNTTNNNNNNNTNDDDGHSTNNNNGEED